ncbi:putative Sm-like protein LSM7 [Cocos nucifera]|uniref:Putative Sm-like protein LSM7 n=1 Tax=Cocos nucifera TaxID=13894 RepID=A0A8K0MV60_COCNU|nr:putative Sm-like protein LSM7 [Cocos nucifera]
MGCASSKILMRSGSFQQEVKQSKQRKTNGLEELFISKDGGDQFLALLRTANTVARKIKASSRREEPETDVEATIEPTNSKTMDVEESDSTANPENELTNIETINAWELLSGLEEGKEDEQHQQREYDHNVQISDISKDEDYKFIIPSTTFNLIGDNSNGVVTQTRSIHTVEDYDAMVAGNYPLEEGKYMTETSRSTDVQLPTGSDSLIRECSTISATMEHNGAEQEKHEELELKSIGKEAGVQENVDVKPDKSEKGPKRKAMAKELTALKVPAFEFSRTGSLREWLKLGGQVFSPGSYVTPKFGNFVSQDPRNGEIGCDRDVFDPDLIAQFEQAMKQLTMEEEFVLEQIIESLEKGHEGDISREEISEEHIQV